MEMPLWFANLVFWSVQVALLVLTAGVLPRALKLRQPRVLFAYWRRSSRRACYSRLFSPGIAHAKAHRWLSPLTLLAFRFPRHPAPPPATGIFLACKRSLRSLAS